MDIQDSLPSPHLHFFQLVFKSPFYSLVFLCQLGKRRLYSFVKRRTWNFAQGAYSPGPLKLSNIPPIVHIPFAKRGKPGTSGVGMIIFILHGINSHPMGMFPFLDELKKQIPGEKQNHFLVCVPPLFKKGNASIDQIVARLWHDYVKKELSLAPSHIPVTIIGTSLGGVVALALRLKMEPHRRVHVATIGSPLRGTLWIDVCLLLKTKGFDLWTTGLKREPTLLQALKVDSTERTHVIRDLKQKKYLETTRYLFVASIQDHLILPCNSGLLNMKELDSKGNVVQEAHQQYILLKKANHIGLQMEAAPKVIKTLLIEWEAAAISLV